MSEHTHHHHHHHHGDAEGNISVAFFLNAIFVVIEVVGGIWTNSIAILSDALHDFGDCLSLGIAWGLQKKSKQGRNDRYTYGYKRFSLLGSLFLSGVLAVSSVLILIEAVKRLLDPQEVSAQGMIWISILGILINGAAALRVKRGSSLNEKAVYLHIMEDALGWVAVLVVSITMMFVNVPYLDTLLSIGISIWVGFHVYGNLQEVFRVLLQGTPEDLSLDDLKNDIQSIPGIQSIHDLHVWSMDGESGVMTLHVVSEVDQTHELKHQIIEMGHRYHIEHVTTEFEKPGEECCCNCDAPFENDRN